MCTAATYTAGDHYFGRNLDLELSYGEKVTITPRNFPLTFRKMPTLEHHYALIGMATTVDNYPLYFDATNEKGLSMAGLNYPGNADYKPYAEGKDNVSPFEFVSWILGQCATLAEAKVLLDKINLVKIDFSEQLPLSPLHWLMAETASEKTLTIECDRDGLHVYDNPVGVLTNNPQFDKQLFNLNNYQFLSPQQPENKFSQDLELDNYSRGLGTRGLPGGMDSMSRFVKVAFTKLNAPKGETENENVGNFFHILHSVEQQKNLDGVENNQFEFTIYSSCVNADRGIYYYTTYDNNQINTVDMHKVDLDGRELIDYDLANEQNINWQN